MADTLEAIVAQLQERVDAARREAEGILAAARAQAAALVAEAEAEAARLRAEGAGERQREREAQQARLAQATRDLLLQLREATVQAVLRSSLEETLLPAARDPAVLREAVVAACQAFVARGGERTELAVLLGEPLGERVAAELRAALGDALAGGVEVRIAGTSAGGFRLLREEEGYLYDFTEEALLQAFSAAYGKEIEAAILAEPRP